MARSSDYRTEQVGLRLVHHLAPAVLEAREHLRREQQICDGWVSRGETAGRGSSDNTTTEAAVIMAEHLQETVDKITKAVAACEAAAETLARIVVGGIGLRVPAAAEQLRCKDAQHGLDSHLWSDDVNCGALPDKKGLCQRHYSAWRRYRVSQNIDTSRDFALGI